MNLLEKICKELGVEIGETWESNDGYEYKINEYGEIWEWDKLHDEWIQSTFTLRDVVIGELRPVWKPKDGEMYYTPRFTHDQNHRYCADVWRNGKWDNWAYDNKLIFKTKEEAINCAHEMIILAKQGI